MTVYLRCPETNFANLKAVLDLVCTEKPKIVKVTTGNIYLKASIVEDETYTQAIRLFAFTATKQECES